MRIGIDVRKIDDTGIGRYIENLVENLLTLDEENEYVLFSSPEGLAKYNFPTGRVVEVIEASKKYSVSEHFTIPRKASKHQIDLFHSPHYVLPYFITQPSVVTIHDIIHLKDRTVGKFAKNYAHVMIGNAVRKSRRVLTVSQTTKNDLESYFNIDPVKIKVIHNGGGSDFHPTDTKELIAILEQMSIFVPYFLYVGSDRPHKNINAIASVMKHLDDKARFVIVGRVSEVVKQRFAKFGDNVLFFDNLGKPEMTALYTGASALLFPSYLEGFGLPPLEAMACNTPVVCSNRSCLPEIVGNASVLVDPDDHKTQAKELVRLVTNKPNRRRYVKLGQERVKLFSWLNTAKATMQCYKEAVQ